MRNTGHRGNPVTRPTVNHRDVILAGPNRVMRPWAANSPLDGSGCPALKAHTLGEGQGLAPPAQLRLSSSGMVESRASVPFWRRSTRRHRVAGSEPKTSDSRARACTQSPRMISDSSCPDPHPA